MIWHYWWVWTNTYCGVLEVIKAVVCENKPSSFPGFHSSSWNINEFHPFTQTSKLWMDNLYSIFGFLQLGTYLLRKQAGTAAAEDVKLQGRSREEEKEKEGEEEEKGFISNSGQRPRHAEENNQNLSLSCRKKGSLLLFSKFPTRWADKSGGVKKPTSDTGGQIQHSPREHSQHTAVTPIDASTPILSNSRGSSESSGRTVCSLPSFRSQPSLSGLKKVCVRSFPSSSGILKGSFLILSYRFWKKQLRYSS